MSEAGSGSHDWTAQEFLARDVWCLFGLPLDAVDPEGARLAVIDAIHTRRRCFVSTPNLNFLIQSRSDGPFRRSVVDSDLALVDGMPLVWLARLLGLPLEERVAGSTLFQTLCERWQGKPLSVFFFGGLGDVAEQALATLPERYPSALGAGALNPGKGDVESMSTSEILDQINRAKPDFLVVSLGANKGQDWIVRNRTALDVPVVSHLGAVVNFVAGTVQRAPLAWQRLGAEWLWRIVEEPALWRRYLNDGLGLLRLVATRALPLALLQRRLKQQADAGPPRVQAAPEAGGVRLCLAGAFEHGNLDPLREQMVSLVEQSPAELQVELDLSELTFGDGAFWGLLQIFVGLCERRGGSARVGQASVSARKLARLYCIEHDLGMGH